jgi:hypothetical protein
MNKEFNKEEYNKLCAEFMGWEYFTKSKSADTWPDGCPTGDYTTFDIWIKNPTEKYREILCHNGWEYLGDKYNDEISQSDLFEDYKYSLKYDTDWNWIMEVVEKIERLGYTDVFDIDKTHVFIRYGNHLIFKPITTTKKEAVIQAIWEFLNWYNENK